MNKKYIISGIILLILLALVGMYSSGWRITNHFTLGKVGGVTMVVPYKNTSVYIDQSDKIVTTKDSEVINLSLSPSEHSVIVSRDGYFPWTKDFTIISGGKVSLSPFIIFQNPSGVIIPSSDPEYFKIKNKISANILPTKEKPIISKDKNVSVWVESNTIFAKLGENTEEVVTPESPVKNISFYKDYSSAIIFSSGDKIYAIDIDKIGEQNFMPIYTGTNPTFAPADQNSIYVSNGNTLMQVLI
jgi:hypothetical protein